MAEDLISTSRKLLQVKDMSFMLEMPTKWSKSYSLAYAYVPSDTPF